MLEITGAQGEPATLYLCERQEVWKDLVVSKRRTCRGQRQKTVREKLRGVEGVGGAEGFSTCAKEAQVGQVKWEGERDST